MGCIENIEFLSKEVELIQERLIKYVSDKGIKQNVLAKKCGMTPMAVSSSMRNERRLTLEEYAAICRFFGISMDYFNKDDK